MILRNATSDLRSYVMPKGQEEEEEEGGGRATIVEFLIGARMRAAANITLASLSRRRANRRCWITLRSHVYRLLPVRHSANRASSTACDCAFEVARLRSSPPPRPAPPCPSFFLNDRHVRFRRDQIAIDIIVILGMRHYACRCTRASVGMRR